MTTEKVLTETTLNDWAQLTEEQQDTLKASLLKSLYGTGGEHFSLFPTLLDKKENPWANNDYPFPARVGKTQFLNWKPNGEIKILPVDKDNKTHYLIILLPEKNLKMDIWNLEKETAKPFLKYETHEKIGTITLGKKHYIITNLYTNKNKAYNQARALTKLFQLGTLPETLENDKELRNNLLQLTIDNGKWELHEIGTNSSRPTGKKFQTIGEYLGREQHKNNKTDYMELLKMV